MAQKEKVFWDSDTFSWDEKEMIDNYREAFNIDETEEVDMDKVRDFADWTNLNYLSDLDYEFDHYDDKTGLPSVYVIVAQIGRWNGTFDGGKVVYGLKNAIHMCFEDYNKIYQEGKMLKVRAVHHDGTNHFIIKKLTDRGIEFYNNHYYDYDDRTIHQKLFKDAHYSHSVDFFARIYGWVKNRKEVK